MTGHDPQRSPADRRRTRRHRSAARRPTSSTSARSRSSTSSRRTAFAPVSDTGDGPYRLQAVAGRSAAGLRHLARGRRGGRHPHPVADAVPADRQGLLHDLRQLLRGDPHLDAEPDRGDRHGPARPPQRGLADPAWTGSPARSTSISTPRGGCSRWSACCTGADDGASLGALAPRVRCSSCAA